MIRSFRHKGVAGLWSSGGSARIDARMAKRVLLRLDALNVAKRPQDMRVPGFAFPALDGFEPTRYTVHVNGPWCITFGFSGEDAEAVDYERYP